MEWRNALVSISFLLVLCIVHAGSPWLSELSPRAHRFIERLFFRGNDVSSLSRHSNGYYEALIDTGRQTPKPSLFVSAILSTGVLPNDLAPPGSLLRATPGYRVYVFPRNAEIEFTGLTTNSLGHPDREYDLVKPAGSRRAVLVGDSIGRGYGARFGYGWEPRLETYLNERHAGQAHQMYEIINLSTDGHRFTQMLDVALEDGPMFGPDVYLMEMADLKLADGLWSDHLVHLVAEGRDLKYPFLATYIGQLQLLPGMPEREIRRYLEGHRRELLRRVLEEMQGHVSREHATLVVLLMPTIDAAESPPLRHTIDEVRGVLRGLAIPTIDATHAFDGYTYYDRERIRFRSPYVLGDAHPNDDGYRLLADEIYRLIVADSVLKKLIIGVD